MASATQPCLYPSVPPLKFAGVTSPSRPCRSQGVPLALEHQSAVPVPAVFKGCVSSRKGRCLCGHLLDHVSQARGQWQSTAQISWDPTQGSPYSVRGRSTLRDLICCFLPLCAVSQGLSSLSVPGKQERAELHAVLRTEIMGQSTCLDPLQ